MQQTAKTLALFPLEAVPIFWDQTDSSDLNYPEPVAIRTKVFDPSRPLFEIIAEEFQSEHPNLSGKRGERMRPFSLLVATEIKNPPRKSELEQIRVWEDPNGLVNAPIFGFLNGYLSFDDIENSYRSRYIKHEPKVVYVIPLQGVGVAGSLELDLLSNLYWLGVGLIAGEVLSAGKTRLQDHQVTREARLMARSFKDRNIHAVEAIRIWAATRENWTTFGAAKKLGVSHAMTESIFGALGYVKRYEDQTWRLGRLEESLRKQQEWIDGEPNRGLMHPTDTP